jgi:Ca-activated chloride channel family protein
VIAWVTLFALAPAEAVAETTAASVFEDVVLSRLDLWWTLFSIPLAVACFVWAARRRRFALDALGNQQLVGRLLSGVNHGGRIVRAILVILALAAICGGLMRLQYGGTAKIVPASGLDVVLAVDYSKSMLAQDVYPSRSERLEAELARFMDDADRRGDRVGLVVFAGGARGLPVTRDLRLLRLYLERADPKSENPGGTAIGKALAQALRFLREARMQAEELAGEEGVGEADQVIILLTDGEDTASRPLEVAEEAAKLGIRIYTVGIGSKSGEPVQKFDENGEPSGYQTDKDGKYVMTRLDDETLVQLADMTGGKYIHVEPDRFGLDEVRGLMGDLSRAQRQDTIEIRRDEGFAFLIVPALFFLVIALAIPERRRRR